MWLRCVPFLQARRVLDDASCGRGDLLGLELGGARCLGGGKGGLVPLAGGSMLISCAPLAGKDWIGSRHVAGVLETLHLLFLHCVFRGGLVRFAGCFLSVFQLVFEGRWDRDTGGYRTIHVPWILWESEAGVLGAC